MGTVAGSSNGQSVLFTSDDSVLEYSNELDFYNNTLAGLDCFASTFDTTLTDISYPTTFDLPDADMDAPLTDAAITRTDKVPDHPLFGRFDDQPWNPHRLLQEDLLRYPRWQMGNRQFVSTLGLGQRHQDKPPSSETDSVPVLSLPSESGGYVSISRGSHSVADSDDYSSTGLTEINPNPETIQSLSAGYPSEVQGSSIYQHSSLDEPFDLTCSYPRCGHVARNRALFRKHKNSHDKPYKCSVTGCPKDDGFTTKNDLDRHRKSVHGIMPSGSNNRSYLCKGKDCSRKDRLVARLDNFRAHCARCHPDENVDDLIAKSEFESDKLPEDLSRQPQFIFTSGLPSAFMQSGSLSPRTTDSNHAQDINRNITLTNPQSHEPSQIPLFPDFACLSREKLRESSPLNTGSIAFGSAEQNEIEKQISQDTQFERYQMPYDSIATAGMSQDSPNIDRMIPTTNSFSDQSIGSVRKTSTEPERSSQYLRKRYRCPDCSKILDRPCDLKKHRKRHERPWGCTDTLCKKTFGSKNDWKRHETSQHSQPECWRCDEPSLTSKISVCASVYGNASDYRYHLVQKHGYVDGSPELMFRLSTRQISEGWSGTFWCGFCNEIIQPNEEGLTALQVRFKHIDDKHFKRGQTVLQWYPPDSDLPKEQLWHKDVQDARSGHYQMD